MVISFIFSWMLQYFTTF
ncbi:hypothetical protein NGA_0165200 [Nannochloropsis gaditana CCMP526]|nr:hypothetical protein NGA_0165200 [Nannochloropsis gaditana CCMP526]EKU21745.1 hypothetical protein NGA_0165200 [Nannochloropsis gaditana CCMP526]|eukprot:XP_005854612.1 hypothetical protein NGA_0165200 [Nannochloropsis gaditana CCMP526]